MKTPTILRLCALAFLAAAVNFSTAHATKVVYTIGDGGSLSWNHSTDESCGCPFDGGGCKITITMDIARLSDNGNGTWHVEGAAQQGLYDITSPILFQKPFANLGNYTFANGYFLTNESFPNVPAGTRVNLNGVRTDAAGRFIADVAK
ncbi:MAG TPA: hypothetical protein VHI13_14545 [Candidatus Kapabacteria bacterium]|nr:hypothetical protein [Candidatus Kapabacteria bacterium]